MHRKRNQRSPTEASSISTASSGERGRRFQQAADNSSDASSGGRRFQQVTDYSQDGNSSEQSTSVNEHSYGGTAGITSQYTSSNVYRSRSTSAAECSDDNEEREQLARIKPLTIADSNTGLYTIDKSGISLRKHEHSKFNIWSIVGIVFKVIAICVVMLFALSGSCLLHVGFSCLWLASNEGQRVGVTRNSFNNSMFVLILSIISRIASQLASRLRTFNSTLMILGWLDDFVCHINGRIITSSYIYMFSLSTAHHWLHMVSSIDSGYRPLNTAYMNLFTYFSSLTFCQQIFCHYHSISLKDFETCSETISYTVYFQYIILLAVYVSILCYIIGNFRFKYATELTADTDSQVDFNSLGCFDKVITTLVVCLPILFLLDNYIFSAK